MNHNSPGQRNTLLLTAGKLCRHSVFQVSDLDYIQNLNNRLFNFSRRNFPLLQAKSHIIENRHMGKDCIILKHHAHVPLVDGNIVYYLTINFNRSTFNGIKADDHT